MDNTAFELGVLALQTSLTDKKFNQDGHAVISNNWKAEKGKVFVTVILGVEKPQDVTPEYVVAKLKEYAAGEWDKTHHGTD